MYSFLKIRLYTLYLTWYTVRQALFDRCQSYQTDQHYFEEPLHEQRFPFSLSNDEDYSDGENDAQ